MPGAYSTFDTLSMELGEVGPPGLVAPTKPLPVLARISRIDLSRDAAEAHHQVEAAHAAAGPKYPKLLPGATSFVIRTDVEEPSVNEDEADESGGQESGVGECEAAVVEDAIVEEIVVEEVVVEPAIAKSAEPAPEEKVSSAELAPLAAQPQAASWVDTLVRVEAAVAPYSQIIVLITLLAAASLTLVLLRGQGGELESGSPQSTSSSGVSLAGEPETPARGSKQLDKIEWGAIEFDASPEKKTSPAETLSMDQSTAPVEKATTTAMGPVSAPKRRKSAADIEPLEPHRVANAAPEKPAEEQIRVAATPPPYPATPYQSTGAGAAGSSSGRPQAQLEGRLLPIRQ